MKPPYFFIIFALILVAAVYWLRPSPRQGSGISLIVNQPLPTELPAPAQDKLPKEQTVLIDMLPPPTGNESTQKAVAPDLKTAAPLMQLPTELRDMIRDSFIAYGQGNYDFAALIALDAVEISDNYPLIKTVMLNGAGLNYEKLGFIDMAIEQYQLALELTPKYRPSYKAMRRLDPVFAANNPELPKPERKKPATRPSTAITTTQQ